MIESLEITWRLEKREKKKLEMNMMYTVSFTESNMEKQAKW
jgi:hypothetical protein